MYNPVSKFDFKRGAQKSDRKRKNSDTIGENRNFKLNAQYTIPRKTFPVNEPVIHYAQPLKSGNNMSNVKDQSACSSTGVPKYPVVSTKVPQSVRNMWSGNDQVASHRVEVPKSSGMTTNYPPRVGYMSAGKYPDGCKRMEVPNSAGVTINHICVRDGYVVSGSNGYLSKCTSKVTTIFKTGTTDNIWQSELIVVRKKMYIAAFTRLRVLIFHIRKDELQETMEFPEEYVDNIANVYFFKNLIFITLKTGQIKRIRETVWKFVDEYTPSDADIRCIFTASLRSFFWLATFQDSLFYKMGNSKNRIQSQNVIHDMKDVKGVVRCNKDVVLCYSDNNAWFLDENCNIEKCLTFECGIKLVESDLFGVVVVDERNTIHVYSTGNKQALGTKKFEKSMGGVITSVAVKPEKVFMVMDNGVYTYPIR